jgi:hypothetical protein
MIFFSPRKRVINKTDVNRTGNKPIPGLSPAERIIKTLLDGDKPNPQLHLIPGMPNDK